MHTPSCKICGISEHMGATLLKVTQADIFRCPEKLIYSFIPGD